MYTSLMTGLQLLYIYNQEKMKLNVVVYKNAFTLYTPVQRWDILVTSYLQSIEWNLFQILEMSLSQNTKWE